VRWVVCAEGCVAVGELLSSSEFADDRAKAVRLFRHACRGDDPMACHNLGVALADGQGVAENAAQAAAPFEPPRRDEAMR
jgi:TPR repeat protein